MPIILDSINPPVLLTLTISQTSPSDGGMTAMDTTTVANYAPSAPNSQGRIVTNEDHQSALLSAFSNYVLDVVALNTDNYSTMTGVPVSAGSKYYNNVYLYILPRYSDNITNVLSQNILNYLEQYKMSTITYNLMPITYIYFNFNISFKSRATSSSTSNQVTAEINAAVTNYFNRLNRNLGEEIKYSDILSRLQSISDVSSLTLAVSSSLDNAWHYSNVQLAWNQFPKLNNSALTISFSGTGV